MEAPHPKVYVSLTVHNQPFSIEEYIKDMVIREKLHAPQHEMQWSPCDLSILNLLGQQRALNIEHFPGFLTLSQEQEKMHAAGLKSMAHNSIERLQRGGLVTVRQFEHAGCWCWLSKEGLRQLGISSLWKRPSRSELPALHATNTIRLMLSKQYPHASWISRQQLRMEQSLHRQSFPVPTAELDLDGEEYIAIHVVLRLAGSEDQIAARMQQQLQREVSPGKPYYTSLWYYATPEAAERLRSARTRLVFLLAGREANHVNIFSYPPIPKVLYCGHRGPVRCLDWSKDGQRIASASEDQTLQVWEAATGSLHFSSPLLTPPARILAWSTDNQFLAAADEEGIVTIWEATTGELLSTTAMHTNEIMGLAWAPYPVLQLVSCSIDGSLQMFDVERNEVLWRVDAAHASGVSALAWSSDGTRLATGGTDTQVCIWDAALGQHLLTYKKHPHTISTLTWSPDSRSIASASDNLDVQIWDAQSGKKVRTIWTTSGMAMCLKWSPDGSLLAWAGDDPVVEIYNPSTGKRLQTYTDHASVVDGLAWSPDSMQLASASKDGTVHVYYPGRQQ